MGYKITFLQDERKKSDVAPDEYDGIICNSFFQFNDIEKFPKLQFVQLTSAGYDRFPMDYAKKRGISVFNAGSVYSIPIAEWTVLKILEIYKHSRNFYAKQSRHIWEKDRGLEELNGRTACILGMGNIGIQTAIRLKSFNVKLIGIDSRETGKEYVDKLTAPDDMDGIIAQSDIIIIALPLDDSTYHLINAERIRMMKDSAVIINISRGSIIDEQALAMALNAGKFAGIAMDVFEKEPLNSNSVLWDIERVIITPHNAFVSDRSEQRLFELIYSNLRAIIEGNQ